MPVRGDAVNEFGQEVFEPTGDVREEFRAAGAEESQVAAVAKPEEGSAGVAEGVEVERPEPLDAARVEGGETVAMKVDVPRFVAEDQLAHGRDRLVVTMPADDAVITGADDLDDEQHEHFELNAQRAPAPVEQAEGERGSNVLAVEALHCMPEQPRMFAFLSEPEIDEAIHFCAGFPKILRVACDEPAFAAAIAQLIFGERTREGGAFAFGDGERHRPVRLRPVEPIGFEVSDPVFRIHSFRAEGDGFG